MTATWNSTELAATAPDRRFLGTRFGVMACPAGAQNARASPNNTTAPNTTRTSLPPESVNQSRTAAPVETVRELSAGQHQRDERQEMSEPDEGQVARPVRQVPHLESRDDIEHLPSQRARQAAECVARKIRLSQRL